MTREEWLNKAVDSLKPLFVEIGQELPTVRVSVGFPGGRGNKSNTIGQCWKSTTTQDKVPSIFIHPSIEEPIEVLNILVHELIHAVDDCESGHRGAFTRMAREIGLTGKMTSTTLSEDLKARLEAEILPGLGEYPHSALNPSASGVKKQTTRMLKVTCAESGYTVRLTRKWLDEYGTPVCPCCDEKMGEA